jgi:3-isopropylmalate/(R)-2-methylmalate dehydratase large subunit
MTPAGSGASSVTGTSGEGGRSVNFDGRVLYLTEDPDLLRAELSGARTLHHADVFPEGKEPVPLLSNISTDELTPGWVCYYYDETLARYCLVGLRGGVVEKDSIKNGGFSVIVSGISKGCGSSRETAPYSELKSGVRLVIARSIEKIYGQNAQNIGLLTSTDMGLLPRIERGEAIPLREFTKGEPTSGSRTSM